MDPGPVWMCPEDLSHTHIRSPDRPARSEWLYRLSYPGPQYNGHAKQKFSVNLFNWLVCIVKKACRICETLNVIKFLT